LSPKNNSYGGFRIIWLIEATYLKWLLKGLKPSASPRMKFREWKDDDRIPPGKRKKMKD
jgi:hypothetical protein